MPVLLSACWPAGSVWLPFLDCKPEDLGKMLCRSVEKPVPVMCQGNRSASRWCTGLMSRILTCVSPAPTNTPYDAGPYITLGMCYAAHPDTGPMM